MPNGGKPRDLAVEYRALDSLTGYARNARTHSDEQVAEIAGSIREFGWTNPILVDGDNGIIAGHGRLLAARKLGLTAVPVIELADLSPVQKRAYILADNKLALNAGWDNDLLALELGDLRDAGVELGLTGFTGVEVAGLAQAAGGAGKADNNDADDDVPAPTANPAVRSGDLWRMGDHRLLCGDSTDASSIARLMDGEHASLCFTSPPYGQQRDYANGGIGDWDALMRGVFAALPMQGDGQVLVNLGLIHKDSEWQPYWQVWLDWMRTQGWRRFGLYVWDQGAGMPGDWSGRLAPAFEFVFHFNRKPRQPNKIVPCKTAGEIGHEPGTVAMRKKDGSFNTWTHGGKPTQPFRIPDSVIRIERHHGSVGTDISHPAPFPVGLASHVMETYSDEGDIVFEPFCGSGTSIVAAQNLKRRVYAVEIAPEYCDVTIKRCRERFPDLSITLDGRDYKEVAAERLAA